MDRTGTGGRYWDGLAAGELRVGWEGPSIGSGEVGMGTEASAMGRGGDGDKGPGGGSSGHTMGSDRSLSEVDG